VKSDRLMRWLTLGANIGVLIGLALLIVELNQNRNMMRAQTRHDLAMGIVDLLLIPATNQQLADVMVRANSGAALTPTEHYQFRMRSNALLRYWENVHYQYRVGLYDEVEFLKQLSAWKASMASSPRMTEYWCQVRLLYSPDFMSEMDKLLAKATCQ